jgi:HAD superfamily hydrolase (TIGR01490 family)
MTTVAAIFDVDRTLVPISTERLFFAFLLWRRVISPLQALSFFKELALHHHDRFSNKSYLRGLSVPRLESQARDCYQKLIKPRLSPVGQACLREHQKKCHQIVILTGSLECLMLPLHQDLKADWLIATRLQTASNCYTGFITGLHPRGKNKLHLLQELSRVAGFELSQSFAYADHTSDLPLLQHIGHPVAVNPSSRLKMFAQAHSWPIRRF